MTILHLIRHGATDWNTGEGRYCGSSDISDIDINQLGIMQAKALAERLKDELLEAFYSSPMRRTMHTAELLARPHGLKVSVINELRERSYGAWEGLTVKEINEKFPGSYQKYEVDPGSYSPPDGETGFEVGERVARALASITERHKDCSLALVAHEATIRILLCRTLGISVSDYRRRLVQSNAGLTIVGYCEGQSKLLLYNDTSHLAGLR